MLTIVVIISLNKAPAVNVDDLASKTSVAAKHVKAADHLAEPFTNSTRPVFLFVIQVGDKPDVSVSRRPPNMGLTLTCVYI